MIECVEVVIIKSQADRQALDDKGRQILAISPPLFLGISLAQLLKDITTDEGDSLLLQVLRLSNNLLALLFDLCQGLFRSYHAPHLIKGVHIERQAIQFTLIIGNWTVGEPVELSKLRDIFPDLCVVSVEDMCAVDMNIDTFHVLGVDISRDVRTFIHY